VCLGSAYVNTITKEAEIDPRTGRADIDTAGNALSHYLLDLAINQCKTASRFVSSFALIP